MIWSYKRLFLMGAMWMGIVLCGAVLDSNAGGLTIAPTRLMFDGKTRVATVHLSNRSDREATYRIFVEDKEMLETGQIVDLENPTRHDRPAKDLVRYSPRRVILPPGGSQTVRVMLRNPSSGKLDHGEYRTHLIFQSVPPVQENDDGRLKAHAILETSIPVIIRRDKPSATIQFTSAKLDSLTMLDGRPQLLATLARQGERSVYGNLSVTWVIKGRSVVIAQLNGLAVYHPTAQRHITIPLSGVELPALTQGELLVQFEETALGHGDLFCDMSLNLTPEPQE